MNNNSDLAVALAASLGALIAILIVVLAIAAFMIVAQWKIYTKAGKEGWTSIVPIYQFIVLMEIVGKPAWWIILLIIPGVNFIILIIIAHRLSLSFGKDIGFTLGLIFLLPIFVVILGFGSAQYVGPGGNANVTPVV